MRKLRKRATAVIIRNGCVFLVEDIGKIWFSLPGGRVHSRDSVVAAAAREVFDELGLNASLVERVEKFDFSGSYNRNCACIVHAEGAVIFNDRELSEFKWWDRNADIARYDHVDAILKELERDAEVPPFG